MTRIVAVGCMGLLVFAAGCASVCPRAASSPAPTTVRADDAQLDAVIACVHTTGKGPQGIVFVVDGAGRFQTTSQNMREVIEAAAAPLVVHTHEWGHGFLRILQDHLDADHMQATAQELAQDLEKTRQRVGASVPIYVVSQSAGCALAVYAAEKLPPDTIDRLILLAPPMSADYDLRPALRATRHSIDSFCSHRDLFILGVCTTVFGTSDGCRSAPAGRVGFRLPQDGSDRHQYNKLRQYSWQHEMGATGYHGGHLCINRAAFMQSYVLPLLRAGPDRPVEHVEAGQ